MAKNRKNKEVELDKYFKDKDYRKKAVKKKKTERYSFKFIVSVCLICFLLFGGYLFYLAQTLPSLSELENPKLEEATKIYSENGELIDKFFLQNRTNITYNDIPQDMINALIATEDRKFYNHWGVDVPRIFQAFVKNVMRGNLKKEGASTITQQLAKKLFVGDETTLNRKLREAMTAIQMERTYTKEEIITYYLNAMYFGNGAYGIQAAAQTYFSKDSKDLNLNEAAMLVALLKSPTNYDPVNKHDNSIGRRNLVLDLMYEEGYISNETCELSKSDPIKLAYKKENTNQNYSKAPEFTEYVRQILQQKAEIYGYDLYRDGLKVYTTLDTRFQLHAENAVKDHIKGFQKSFTGYWNWNSPSHREILSDAVDKYIKQSEEYKKAKTENDRSAIYNKFKNSKTFVDSVKTLAITVQVGFTVMNPKTGEIKAMVGGNPNSRFKYGLNHVTQIKRQPGSSFKPFVYAVAVNNGYNPGYMVSNDPININVGGSMWSPKGGGGGGKMSMRVALAKSINVVAVRTAMDLAPIDKVISLAHDMGVKSDLPNFLSLSLGAGEVSPLEMTNAFGTFANEGIWVEPIAITRIEDRNGNIIEEFLPETREVMSEGAAYIMSDMMQDVIDEGTATSIRQFFHRPAAGKTGTSQDHTDAWFVGYTPQFVAGCWVGFDDARIKLGSSFGQGGKASAPIWGRFMKSLYEDDEFDFPIAYFLMPDDVDEVDICTQTGMLDNGGCPSIKEVVLKKFMPKKCNMVSYYNDYSTETSSESTPPEGSIGY